MFAPDIAEKQRHMATCFLRHTIGFMRQTYPFDQVLLSGVSFGLAGIFVLWQRHMAIKTMQYIHFMDILMDAGRHIAIRSFSYTYCQDCVRLFLPLGCVRTNSYTYHDFGIAIGVLEFEHHRLVMDIQRHMATRICINY